MTDFLVHRAPVEDLERVEGWLGRIRYKPDTRFEVLRRATGYGDVQVEITRSLADSTKGLSTLPELLDLRNHVRVQAVLLVPPYYLRTDDFDSFQRWLYHELVGMERHEINEWWRVDDTLPFDPHKGKQL